MTSIYILITKMQNKTRKTKLNSKQKSPEKIRECKRKEKNNTEKPIKQNVELLRGLIKSINF